MRHPVVRLDFSGGDYGAPGDLRVDLMDQLEEIAEDAGVALSGNSAPACFRRLLKTLHHTTGRRVVVLVDEYDKPILDVITDSDLARANRDFLRGLYGCLKFSDRHIRFVFLTGVSKFSRVSLFSGLNNLIDITLNPAYSSICGFTETDLDKVFSDRLEGLDRDRIRDWYNGYSWLGTEKVYNPYDVLMLMHERCFKPHWFRTGTPKFLVDTLIERAVPTVSLGGITAGEDLLSTFDVDHIATEALLFQTGYLTIVGEEDPGVGLPLYRLDYPNLEVRMSLNRVLLRWLTQDHSLKHLNRSNLPQLLVDGDFEGIRVLLYDLYAKIPYEWYTKKRYRRI